MSVRRSIGFIVYGVVVWWASNLYSWRKDNGLDEMIGDSPVKSFVFFALVLAFVILAGVALAIPNRLTVALALLVGLIAGAVGASLFEGITWWFILLVIGALVVVVFLWIITTWDDLPGWLGRIPDIRRTAPATP